MPLYDSTWNNWTYNTSNTTITTMTPGFQNLGYSYNRATWNNWNANYTITYTTTNPAPETEDQRRVREANLERKREELAIRRREKEERQLNARVNARALLKSVLSEEQWNDWLESQQIELVGSEGNQYRLTPGTNGNITMFDDEGDIERICAHPLLYDDRTQHQLPEEDVLAAQVLALKTDENHFRGIANIHRRYRDVDTQLIAA